MKITRHNQYYSWWQLEAFGRIYRTKGYYQQQAWDYAWKNVRLSIALRDMGAAK